MNINNACCRTTVAGWGCFVNKVCWKNWCPDASE